MAAAIACSSPADLASSRPPATSLPVDRRRAAAFWAAVERDGARCPALPSPLMNSWTLASTSEGVASTYDGPTSERKWTSRIG